MRVRAIIYLGTGVVCRKDPADGGALITNPFVDYVPEATVVDIAARQPETIAVRSLTKFFAVPALRVGYAVCEPGLARRLRATLPSWPVTSAASRAFVAALADARYRRRSLAANAWERRPVSKLVESLIVVHGIVVRDCSSYQGLELERFIRVAVRGRRDSRRLPAALAQQLPELT